MTPEQFCYWLQGITEYNRYGTPNDEQWTMIRDHLATVFTKVTPKAPNPLPINPLDGCRPISPSVDPSFWQNRPSPPPVIGPTVNWPNRDIAIC